MLLMPVVAIFMIVLKLPNRMKTYCDAEEKQVSCFHGNDGSAILIGKGGTPPYHFLWNDGDTSRYKSSMKAGQYSVLHLTKTIVCKNKCYHKRT